MRVMIWVVGMACLAGCASGPFATSRDLDSGSQQAGTVVYCNGYKTWRDCDVAAARACGGKSYETLAKEENISTQNRSLRIQCK